MQLSNASAEATGKIFPCAETQGEPFNYNELLIGKGDKRKPNGVSRDFSNSFLVTLYNSLVNDASRDYVKSDSLQSNTMYDRRPHVHVMLLSCVESKAIWQS